MRVLLSVKLGVEKTKKPGRSCPVQSEISL